AQRAGPSNQRVQESCYGRSAGRGLSAEFERRRESWNSGERTLTYRAAAWNIWQLREIDGVTPGKRDAKDPGPRTLVMPPYRQWMVAVNCVEGESIRHYDAPYI